MMLITLLSLVAAAMAQGLKVRPIYEWPKYTFLENLAPRANGSLLVTHLDSPYLQQIDPHKPAHGPTTIHEFDDDMAVGGIAETEPDVFAVVAGNFSLLKLTSYSHTYSVWTVDFNKNSSTGGPVVSKFMDLPQAGFLDGMTYVASAKSLFFADAKLGVLTKLNMKTQKYSVEVNNTLTQKCHPSDLESVNGLKYFDGHLYWTNTGCGLYAKTKISPNGTEIGPPTLVSNPKMAFDDFGIAPNGTSWMSATFINQIWTISPEGKYQSVAGNLNSTEIAQPTALRFGITKEDKAKGTLYITTAGGIGVPINGTVIIGAQLLAIDTKLQ